MKLTPVAAVTIASISLFVTSIPTHAETVTFENDNPSLLTLMMFDANPDNPLLGQSLNITRSAFDQPELGELPIGSVLFMETSGFAGDFIFMGVGRLTLSSRANEGTFVPDPFGGFNVPYFGPTDFGIGDEVSSSSNIVDGWRMMHARNHLTDEQGIYSVDRSFTVGISFELDDGVHYGFAQFERSSELRNNELEINWHPIRWGYETVAGVGVNVTPTPSVFSVLCIGSITATKRRRRFANS
jgi:hypothetical protein